MERKENYQEFQTEISARGITQLIHFTPTINLMSIFDQGKILSRALIEEFDIEQTDIFDYVEFTDSIRYDDKSYINLSIQHPNHFLFNRFQQKTNHLSHMKWCILKINPKYIYQKNTLFSVTNAANGHNKRNIKITGDLSKFQLMFAADLSVVTYNGSRTISRLNLQDKYPTDEQAEVLVKNELPLSAIKEVCFRNESELAEGKAALNDFNTDNFVIDSSLFANSRI